MTRSRKRKLQRAAAKWAGMPLASAVLAYSNVASAQQPTSAGTETIGLEEVIVTAQKRTEDMQKVPISLTVLGTDVLEQHQVADFDDFAKLLPSVSYQSLGPGQNQLYFRGIASGSDGLHAGSVPATGVYLDEIPVTTIAGSLDIHMYDIQRVEALAGPQGTLYGASSLSGTLRIITNKPDTTKFSASYDAQANKYGQGRPGGAFEGYVNIPLSDRAAVRLVGYYGYDGGYINQKPGEVSYQRASTAGGAQPITFSNANLPGTVTDAVVNGNDTNGLTTYGGRAALKFDFSDTWSITPQYLYQYANTKGPFIYDPKVGYLDLVDFRPETNKDSWYQTALTVQGKIGNLDLLYSGGYFRRQVNNKVDYTGYTIGYDQNTTYGYTAFYPGGYGTGGPLGNQDPTQYTDNYDTYTKLTNEIRLTSPTDQKFQWLVGAYAQKQTDDIRVEFRIDGLPTIYQVTGQGDVYYLSQQDRADRDTALFGDITFNFTDQFKMSAGLRYFWVDNTLFGFFGFNAISGYSSHGEAACVDAAGNFVPSTNAPNRPCINTDKRFTDSGETHRVNATYQITPDKMLYATYSTGYRPGGNNRKSDAIPYQPDKLTNYEIGWKTTWDDNRFRFNGALFYEKWSQAQLAVQGVSGITSVVNVGDADTKGIEGELSWLPVEHLTLSLSGTYVDAKTTTQFCNANRETGFVTTSCPTDEAVANVGTRLPVTPELKGNLTGRYTFTAGQFDNNYFQASLFHQSSVTNEINTFIAQAMGDSPAFTTFDFGAGMGRGSWQLEAFIQNAFNEHGELGRVKQCNDFAFYCADHSRIYPIKPQFFGIKFSQHF
jgi:outer membrane receptor protein involved in Fe transport